MPIDVHEAASILFESLQTFAADSSNPVLALLPRNANLVESFHYPADALNFSSEVLRAYYHSHPREYRFPGEHGHFHLFIREKSQSEWCHLVGLCMDGQGQPLRWFVTNHWVTAGGWKSAGELIHLFEQAWLQLDAQGLNRIEAWLFGMLGIYSATIVQLMQQRDVSLLEKACVTGYEHTLQDRSVYLLAESSIDLLAHFESLLGKN